MLQHTHGSFADHFHEYLAIFIINIKQPLLPPGHLIRGRRRSKNCEYMPLFGSWNASYIKVHLEEHIILYGMRDA